MKKTVKSFISIALVISMLIVPIVPASAAANVVNDNGYVWPVENDWPTSGGWMTQSYKYSGQLNPSHQGLDITSYYGANIRAVSKGTVYCASKAYPGAEQQCPNCFSIGAGYHVIVKQDDGYMAIYAHLSDVSVSRGAKVSANDIIGQMGYSGNTTGTHLHFALHNQKSSGGINFDSAINPISKLTPFGNVYATDITENSAVLYGWLGARAMPFSAGGFYIGTDSDEMTKIIDTKCVGYDHFGHDVYNLNFSTSEYYGTLQSGTTYYYQIWMTHNGVEYKSDLKAFKTTGTAPAVETYTVTFKDYDGTVISTKTYEKGATVEVPADPTRAADDTYTYTFAGWDKTVTTVSGDATYTATYTATEKTQESIYSGECGDALVWTLDSTTGALVISGTGAMNDWSSNSSVPWYTYRSNIKTVTINDGVTSIGRLAFSNYDSLTSVTIGSGVTSIGRSAFSNNDSLTSINLDERNSAYTTFDGVLFNKDKTILVLYPAGKTETTYTIPTGVTSIGNGAFDNCTSLTSVDIPDSVTSIGNGAFYNCTSLTSIDIPAGVTSIYNNAFLSIWSLTNINVDENNANYTSVDGVLFNKDKTALLRYPQGKNTTSYTIPDGVTTIGALAFDKCAYLQNIVIPDEITSIGTAAFQSCTSLETVTISDSVIEIGMHGFMHCFKLDTIFFEGTEDTWNQITKGQAWDVNAGKNTATGTYKVVFGLPVTTYTVTFKDYDGTVISTKTYHYGESVVIPADPTREADDTYTYAFAGWDKTVTTVSGDATYTATYTAMPKTPAAEKDAIQIVVEDREVVRGNSVEVKVSVKNNTGFSYLEISPVLPAEFELASVNNGSIISDFTTGKQYVWLNDCNVTDDGVLMTFVFNIPDTLDAGEYDIGLIIRGCCDITENDVDCVAVSGTVTVLDIVYGDATGDRIVDGKDLVRLKKYIAAYDYDTETSTVAIGAGADATGDGLIDGKDLVRLKKYIAAYDYDTGTSSIVLGPSARS